MTTEILLNAINKQNTTGDSPIDMNSTIVSDLNVLDIDLSNVNTVIFDEAHMINNPERGKVWEQCFIKLNKNISQILLSATLGNPDTLAKCINGHNGHRTYILAHTTRPVPLQFCAYYTLNESVVQKLATKHNVEAVNKLIPLMNTNDMQFSDASYQMLSTINTVAEKLRLNTISQIAIVNNTIKQPSTTRRYAFKCWWTIIRIQLPARHSVWVLVFE